MPVCHIDHQQAPIAHWHGKKSTYNSERSASWTVLCIIMQGRLPDALLSPLSEDLPGQPASAERRSLSPQRILLRMCTAPSPTTCRQAQEG